MTDKNSRNTSIFEFWPSWVMYFPVAIQWLVLGVRYRSFTLPLIANPRLTLSAMVGASKAELFSTATGNCEKAILPWFLHKKTTDPIHEQKDAIIKQAKEKGFEIPFVCKPDMGCRGAGVKLVRTEAQLEDVLKHYPTDVGMIVQRLSNYSNEVGIFFVRQPEQTRGDIVSMTFKDTPSVLGDGKSTLAELVQKDPRASQLLHLYEERNKNHWNKIIAEGKEHPLLFSASHCRGAVFRDGRQYITPELTAALNKIMVDLPDFHYGRLDVKYRDMESLQAGESLEIVEINGASSEAIHIWDKDTRLIDAFKTLLWQYGTLFKIGNAIRRRGVKTPGLLTLFRAWRKESNVTRYYPETD